MTLLVVQENINLKFIVIYIMHEFAAEENLEYQLPRGETWFLQQTIPIDLKK